MNKNSIRHFFLEIFQYWLKDKVSTLSAAFAYFTLFSLAPILFICIWIAGLVFGKSIAEQHILHALTAVLGAGGAQQLSQMITSQTRPATSIFTSIIGSSLLIFGAIGFFNQLLDGLNIIWGVQPKSGLGIMGVLKTRFFAFLFIVAMSFFLFFSIILSFVLQIFQSLIPNYLIIHFLHFVFFLGSIFLFFLFVYRFLPDVKMSLRNAWGGAVFAAALFVIAQMVLSWYFKHASLNTHFGLASSLILILFWLYFLGQIIFIGAEYIKVYLARKGQKILPSEKAERIQLKRI